MLPIFHLQRSSHSIEAHGSRALQATVGSSCDLNYVGFPEEITVQCYHCWQAGKLCLLQNNCHAGASGKSSCIVFPPPPVCYFPLTPKSKILISPFLPLIGTTAEKQQTFPLLGLFLLNLCGTQQTMGACKSVPRLRNASSETLGGGRRIQPPMGAPVPLKARIREAQICNAGTTRKRGRVSKPGCWGHALHWGIHSAPSCSFMVHSGSLLPPIWKVRGWPGQVGLLIGLDP